MEGVIILDSYISGGLDPWALGGGIWFTILSLLLIGVIIMYARENNWAAIPFLTILLSICVIFTIVAFNDVNSTPEETVYKVIVEDSVPMKEFCEKYDIIGAEGLIYEVKEKK